MVGAKLLLLGAYKEQKNQAWPPLQTSQKLQLMVQVPSEFGVSEEGKGGLHEAGEPARSSFVALGTGWRWEHRQKVARRLFHCPQPIQNQSSESCLRVAASQTREY